MLGNLCLHSLADIASAGELRLRADIMAVQRYGPPMFASWRFKSELGHDLVLLTT